MGFLLEHPHDVTGGHTLGVLLSLLRLPRVVTLVLGATVLEPHFNLQLSPKTIDGVIRTFHVILNWTERFHNQCFKNKQYIKHR